MSSLLKFNTKQAEQSSLSRKARIAKELADRNETGARAMLELYRQEIRDLEGKQGKRVSPANQKKIEIARNYLRVYTICYRAKVAIQNKKTSR
jgi:2-methylcitrate dehydratase PrpD